MGWMDGINMMKSAFKEIFFTHVYRELNMEADTLSKLALTKPEGKLVYSSWVEGNEGPSITINLF
jgi:hypothetical protein